MHFAENHAHKLFLIWFDLLFSVSSLIFSHNLLTLSNFLLRLCIVDFFINR